MSRTTRTSVFATAKLLLLLCLSQVERCRAEQLDVLSRVREAVTSPGTNVSATCRNHTAFYLTQLRSGTPWALQNCNGCFFEPCETRFLEASTGRPWHEYANCMTCMAEDVLTSLKLTGVEKVNYDAVMRAFAKNFLLRTNVIYQRAKFHRHKQKANKTADDFVEDFYKMTETCDYRN